MLGWCIVVLVTFMIAVNLLIITYDSFLTLKLFARRYRKFLCSCPSKKMSKVAVGLEKSLQPSSDEGSVISEDNKA